MDDPDGVETGAQSTPSMQSPDPTAEEEVEDEIGQFGVTNRATPVVEETYLLVLWSPKGSNLYR